MEGEVIANKTSLSYSGGFVGGLLDYALYEYAVCIEGRMQPIIWIEKDDDNDWKENIFKS